MIRSLAYIGIASPNAEAWRTFGPEVLGAQLAADGAGGTVRLRVDEHAPRITVTPAERDDLAHLGWDVGGAGELDAAVSRLREHGIDATHDPALAAERRVEALAAFTDPFGFRHELTHGLAAEGPFTPGRPMRSRFVTGEQGLGHVVLMVPDLDAASRFFADVLGFSTSDHIVMENGMRVRFFHCNPRHHTLAISGVRGHAGLHHLMLQVEDLDDVGTALDIVTERGLTLAMTLGKHTNDLMTSFYVRTPSGFEIEYGAGARVIDDATWTVETYDAMSIWGHKPPAQRLLPGILRPVG